MQEYRLVYTVYWSSYHFVLLFSLRYLEDYSKEEEEEEEEGVRKSKKDVIDLSSGVNSNFECTHTYQIEWKIWNGNWFNIFKQFF